jgi:hypothetical protein
MAQTSIEWLIEVLNHVKPDEFCSIEKVKELCHQAKEMQRASMLSDEEITKLANEYILYNDSKRQWVIEGMKLYREQLKNKL